MKQVRVTILVDIDQDVLADFKLKGYSDVQLLFEIQNRFNSAKVKGGLVEDFDVESVVVKI